MTAATINRSPLRKLVLPVIAAVFLGYFGMHAFSGSYGIRAREQFDVQIEALEAELAALRQETAGYERNASLLRPQTLDPDMVDERARRSLNIIGPNDVVIVP
ncbi:MAG: septum formation initiator family protein [Bauldia sp.]|nr:septum formation initiator family protein [Bauldia sp.]